VVAIINGQNPQTCIYIGTLLMNNSMGFVLKYLWNKTPRSSLRNTHNHILSFRHRAAEADDTSTHN